jgi:hypothetical protein
MNQKAPNGYIAIAQHISQSPTGAVRNTEIVRARWESGKLILEQWTVQQKYVAKQEKKALQYVA